jgi:putative transcriptional regulator
MAQTFRDHEKRQVANAGCRMDWRKARAGLGSRHGGMSGVMSKTYESTLLGVIHEAMSDAYDAGAIGKRTLCGFDDSRLTEIREMAPQDIMALREREGVSQLVLARHLNVAVKVVGEWERGLARPSGPSLKLLALIQAKGLDAIA